MRLKHDVKNSVLSILFLLIVLSLSAREYTCNQDDRGIWIESFEDSVESELCVLQSHSSQKELLKAPGFAYLGQQSSCLFASNFLSLSNSLFQNPERAVPKLYILQHSLKLHC